MPTNTDILKKLGEFGKDIEYIKENIVKIEKHSENMANNNVNQWKAITKINTRCEAHLKTTDKNEDKNFTIKTIIVASISGGIVGLLCNNILKLLVK